MPSANAVPAYARRARSPMPPAELLHVHGVARQPGRLARFVMRRSLPASRRKPCPADPRPDPYAQRDRVCRRRSALSPPDRHRTVAGCLRRYCGTVHRPYRRCQLGAPVLEQLLVDATDLLNWFATAASQLPHRCRGCRDLAVLQVGQLHWWRISRYAAENVTLCLVPSCRTAAAFAVRSADAADRVLQCRGDFTAVLAATRRHRDC